MFLEKHMDCKNFRLSGDDIHRDEEMIKTSKENHHYWETEYIPFRREEYLKSKEE